MHTELRPQRALGHKYDPPGLERGRDIGHLVAAVPTPDFVDLSARVPEVIDQRGSSCEGAATWTLIMLAAYAAGVVIDPSYLAPYHGARALEHPEAAELADVGSYPHLVAGFLEAWGIVSRARWPDSSPLTSPLPIDVLEAGSLGSVAGGVFRVYEERPIEKFARIEQTLAAGFGVSGGMPVDELYMRGPGAVYGPRIGRSLGDHCQTLVGYQRRKPGRPGRYLTKNSWAKGWNGSGYAWLHEDVVADLWRDLTSIRIVPRRLL